MVKATYELACDDCGILLPPDDLGRYKDGLHIVLLCNDCAAEHDLPEADERPEPRKAVQHG